MEFVSSGLMGELNANVMLDMEAASVKWISVRGIPVVDMGTVCRC